MRIVRSFLSLAAAALLALPAAPALAASGETPAANAKPSAKPSAKPVAKPPAKPAGKPTPATSREQLRNEAKGLAAATEAVEQVNEGQLAATNHVNQGDADCEFKQQVSVQAVPDKPGHFHVGFKKRQYLMVIQETKTGAIRLEDKKTGLIWLQIPAKSMLMDARIGQRMVDGCLHQAQKDLPAEPADAASAGGLGIASGEGPPTTRP